MQIISVFNKKGGVGKTSTTNHVGGMFATMGYRTLVVDNDPQASLTQGYFGPDRTRLLPATNTIVSVYNEKSIPSPSWVIVPTPFKNLSILPGSEELDSLNSSGDIWDRSLRDFLRDCSGEYDLILIDNPPNLYRCSKASLVASDWVLVPLQAEDYGAQGLPPVQRAIEAARSGPNPDLRLLGYLITMYDKRTGIHITYDELLREVYRDDVLTHSIPTLTAFKVAVSERTPISFARGKTKAFKDARVATQDVAQEILERIGVMRAAAPGRVA